MTVAIRPRQLDSLLAYAGQAARRCAPGKQRRWALAMGVSAGTASRHLSGCDRYAPNSHVLLTVAKLANGHGTSPWPLIAEAIAVAYQVQFDDMTDAELCSLLSELNDREHDYEAAQNRATMRIAQLPSGATIPPEAIEAAATADIAHAELLLQRAAVARLFAERQRR